MNAKILEFKKNLEAITYEDVLAVRFADLKTYTYEERIGYNGETDKRIKCVFTMDVKSWNRSRKAGNLGHIYNADLANLLYRKGIMTSSYPTVNDQKRASKGRKTIEVTFTVRG